MKQIYMVFLGGYIKQANIELHDIQFVYSEDITNCLNELKKRWFGIDVHIDGYIELKYIDGYRLDPNTNSKENLYLVIYGGYHTDFLGEIHQHKFVVASSKEDAKTLAKEILKRLCGMDHIDEIVDVFQNAGLRMGLNKGDFHFKDNLISNTYYPLIDHHI